MNHVIKSYESDVVVLGFDEHKDKIVVSENRFINLGSQRNLDEIARNIYSALRKADKLGAQIILIEGIRKEGLGIAIMNRLLRSCGYNYIEF